jgi:tetratricopeptide (TPR) repeat protein
LSESNGCSVSPKILSQQLGALLIRGLILLGAFLLCSTGVGPAQITITFPEPHNIVVLSVPDKPAALQIDLLRLKVESNDLRQDIAGRRLQASDSQGWVFSSFLFPRDHTVDSKGLREKEWADLRKGLSGDGLTPEQVKIYEKGSTPMLEYVIEIFRGRNVHQKNVDGYIVSGDMAMDFHISKIAYTPEDRKFLDALVNGITLLENYEPDSKLEYGYGSIFYLQKNWSRAAQHYEKALEREKTKRTLSPTEWKVLIDNLGMAYIASGNFQSAKSTLEYGVHEDATYPMFRYNLACVYAESNDLETALEQLKMAFHYRNNSLPGERGMPDPAKDDSFKRYLGDPRFQNLTQELCPTSTRSAIGWFCK